jgi:histidinol-phosphate aminotransferase
MLETEFNPAGLVRAHILDMPAYEPILPFEVLSRQLGLPIERIIKLDANENPYGPLPAVQDALGALEFTHIYPDPESRDLRRALADYHNVPIENLLAGAGADELIDLLMLLLIETGEAIINCPPTFGMYAFDGDIHRARVINVPRRPDFSLDMQALRNAVTAYQPKLIFLASPNNPDGSLVPPDIIEEILALPVILVLDEAYVEFAPSKSSYFKKACGRPNLVVLRTFSKWAGLAGLRVGYGIFPNALMPHLWKIKQPYNVSVAAYTAARLSLEYVGELQAIGAKIIAERERLYARLREIPWLEPYPSQSNFILCRVLDRDARELKLALARAGILVRYFDKPGLSDHIRISVGKMEHTDAVIARLLEME